MPIQLSPAVTIQELDLTNVIPAVATSTGAAVLEAAWGPVDEARMVTSENDLVQQYGKPNDLNAANWFTAANFLSYSNALYISRADTTNQRNSVVTVTKGVASVPVTTGGTGYSASNPPIISFTAPPSGITAQGVAVVNGSGVVTGITITVAGSGYITAPTVSVTNHNGGASFAPGTAVLTSSGGIKINNRADYDSYWTGGTGAVGEWAAKYPGALGNSITVSMADSASFAAWTYKSFFEGAPGTSAYAAAAGASNDELHIVVVDATGKWSGTAGSVLEKFAFVSKASDGRKSDGSSGYYKTVINEQSKYIYWMAHPTAVTGGTLTFGATTASGSYPTISTAITSTLTGGVDHFVATDGQRMEAFDYFIDPESIDVSLIMVGKANTTVASYVVNSIAEVRKDAMVFVSPQNTVTGDPIVGSTSTDADKIVLYRNGLPSSSFMVVDSGYKYQYDRYNDTYRWVPLNGDIAGLCARTDYTNDPWFSPAGFSRGQIKNTIKLAYNPRKSDRDTLYKSGINPVVTFPGQGTLLYGDKTGLAKPSAFDRINVRRLFITLEKAIGRASRYQLFEINNEQTRAQFRAMVEPFLRDVKGRQGIYDFAVVCDSSNNTGEVIDSNRFVAQIFVKPAKSINNIELTFIAQRTGADITITGA